MDTIQCRIECVSEIAEAIRSYSIVASDNGMLPEWEPGAHIDVHLPSGLVRQYSLCGDRVDRHKYEIAVQRDSNGRGGSRELFEVLAPSSRVLISKPRNNFALADSSSYLFVAGGIGITPIVPMIRAVQETARPFRLVYCSRQRTNTAFADFAMQLAADGNAILHHDEGRPEAQLDIARVLSDCDVGTHLYCCGPRGLMEAAKRASLTWPAGTVHFEYFSNPSQPASSDAGRSFQVLLQNSGIALEVPPDRSILEVLRDNGIPIDSSCESGLCGTCKTRYVAGVPDHRDLVLDDVERRDFLMVCCSRAQSERLVLDL